MTEDEDLPDFLEPPADDDDDDEDLEGMPIRSPVYDQDEALAEAAFGHFTTDEAAEAASEGQIEGMGRAAGLPDRPGKIVTAGEELERRDDDRAELAPESADDRIESHK